MNCRVLLWNLVGYIGQIWKDDDCYNVFMGDGSDYYQNKDICDHPVCDVSICTYKNPTEHCKKALEGIIFRAIYSKKAYDHNVDGWSFEWKEAADLFEQTYLSDLIWIIVHFSIHEVMADNVLDFIFAERNLDIYMAAPRIITRILEEYRMLNTAAINGTLSTDERIVCFRSYEPTIIWMLKMMLITMVLSYAR